MRAKKNGQTLSYIDYLYSYRSVTHLHTHTHTQIQRYKQNGNLQRNRIYPYELIKIIVIFNMNQ